MKKLTASRRLRRRSPGKLYEKWFGPKGEVPYPLTEENKRALVMRVVPR